MGKNDTFKVDEGSLAKGINTFSTARKNFNSKCYNKYSGSYLATSGNKVAVAMRKTIASYFSEIRGHYNSLISYLNDYKADLKDLEEALNSGKLSSSKEAEVKAAISQLNAIMAGKDPSEIVINPKTGEVDQYATAAAIGAHTDALGVYNGTIKYKDQFGNTQEVRNLTQSEYTRVALAGLGSPSQKVQNARLGKELAAKVGAATVAGMANAPVASGVMEATNLSPRSLTSQIGTYTKAQEATMDHVKSSTGYMVGYGAGLMATFFGTGAPAAEAGMVRLGTKVFTKGKGFGKVGNAIMARSADAMASSPTNLLDSIKQGTDSGGKINKNTVVSAMAGNTAMDIGMGAAMGPVGRILGKVTGAKPSVAAKGKGTTTTSSPATVETNVHAPSDTPTVSVAGGTTKGGGVEKPAATSKPSSVSSGKTASSGSSTKPKSSSSKSNTSSGKTQTAKNTKPTEQTTPKTKEEPTKSNDYKQDQDLEKAASAKGEPEVEAKEKAEAPKEEPKVEVKEKAETPKEEPKVEAKEKAEAPKEEPKVEAKEKAEAPKEEPKVEAKEKVEAPKEEPKVEAKEKVEAPKEEPNVKADEDNVIEVDFKNKEVKGSTKETKVSVDEKQTVKAAEADDAVTRAQKANDISDSNAKTMEMGAADASYRGKINDADNPNLVGKGNDTPNAEKAPDKAKEPDASKEGADTSHNEPKKEFTDYSTMEILNAAMPMANASGIGKVVSSLRASKSVSVSTKNAKLLDDILKIQNEKYAGSGLASLKEYVRTGNLSAITRTGGARTALEMISRDQVAQYLKRFDPHVEQRISKGSSVSKLREFFDSKSGTFHGANHGVDQGCLKHLCEYDYKGLKFDFDEITRLQNNYFKESGMRLKVRKIAKPEYAKLKRNLEMQGFSSEDASIIMTSLDDTGACSYASLCNDIFYQFRDNPQEFRKIFGFPMYKAGPNGAPRLNDAELMLDMYTKVNDTSCGGKLFENGKILRRSDKVDVFGRKFVDSDSQQYMSTSLGRNVDLINKYFSLKQTDLVIESRSLAKSTPGRLLSRKEIANMKSKIEDAIRQGDGVSLNITNMADEIRLISDEKSLYPSVSTNSWHEGGGHSVYVTGTNDVGLEVSSWGNRYTIPYKDLRGGGFRLEATTIGKGRPGIEAIPSKQGIPDAMPRGREYDTITLAEKDIKASPEEMEEFRRASDEWARKNDEAIAASKNGGGEAEPSLKDNIEDEISRIEREYQEKYGEGITEHEYVNTMPNGRDTKIDTNLAENLDKEKLINARARLIDELNHLDEEKPVFKVVDEEPNSYKNYEQDAPSEKAAEAKGEAEKASREADEDLAKAREELDKANKELEEAKAEAEKATAERERLESINKEQETIFKQDTEVKAASEPKAPSEPKASNTRYDELPEEIGRKYDDANTYKFDQIVDKRYSAICDKIIEQSPNSETTRTLKEILYGGHYDGYKIGDIGSSIHMRSNPTLEASKRASMAELFLHNPETFDYIVKNDISLFHGTNSKALDGILSDGLNSHAKSLDLGADVKTGEVWSREYTGARDFVSFTDNLTVARGYASLNPNDVTSRPIMIGVKPESLSPAAIRSVGSDLPEIGIKDGLPVEKIDFIGVPTDMLDEATKMAEGTGIKVLPYDSTENASVFYDIPEGPGLQLKPDNSSIKDLGKGEQPRQQVKGASSEEMEEFRKASDEWARKNEEAIAAKENGEETASSLKNNIESEIDRIEREYQTKYGESITEHKYVNTMPDGNKTNIDTNLEENLDKEKLINARAGLIDELNHLDEEKPVFKVVDEEPNSYKNYEQDTPSEKAAEAKGEAEKASREADEDLAKAREELDKANKELEEAKAEAEKATAERERLESINKEQETTFKQDNEVETAKEAKGGPQQEVRNKETFEENPKVESKTPESAIAKEDIEKAINEKPASTITKADIEEAINEKPSIVSDKEIKDALDTAEIKQAMEDTSSIKTFAKEGEQPTISASAYERYRMLDDDLKAKQKIADMARESYEKEFGHPFDPNAKFDANDPIVAKEMREHSRVSDFVDDLETAKANYKDQVDMIHETSSPVSPSQGKVPESKASTIAKEDIEKAINENEGPSVFNKREIEEMVNKDSLLSKGDIEDALNGKNFVSQDEIKEALETPVAKGAEPDIHKAYDQTDPVSKAAEAKAEESGSVIDKNDAVESYLERGRKLREEEQELRDLFKDKFGHDIDDVIAGKVPATAEEKNVAKGLRDAISEDKKQFREDYQKNILDKNELNGEEPSIDDILKSEDLEDVYPIPEKPKGQNVSEKEVEMQKMYDEASESAKKGEEALIEARRLEEQGDLEGARLKEQEAEQYYRESSEKQAEALGIDGQDIYDMDLKAAEAKGGIPEVDGEPLSIKDHINYAKDEAIDWVKDNPTKSKIIGGAAGAVGAGTVGVNVMNNEPEPTPKVTTPSEPSTIPGFEEGIEDIEESVKTVGEKVQEAVENEMPEEPEVEPVVDESYDNSSSGSSSTGGSSKHKHNSGKSSGDDEDEYDDEDEFDDEDEIDEDEPFDDEDEIDDEEPTDEDEEPTDEGEEPSEEGEEPSEEGETTEDEGSSEEDETTEEDESTEDEESSEEDETIEEEMDEEGESNEEESEDSDSVNPFDALRQ